MRRDINNRFADNQNLLHPSRSASAVQIGLRYITAKPLGE